MDFVKEYTVSQLVNNIKTILEQNFYFVKIVGEISDCKISSAGHSYFNLKDKESLINVVLFKNVNSNFKLENGFKVSIFGRLTIYKDRSNYQIIVETIQLQGDGYLLKILEDRKLKLEKMGFFDAKHKKIIITKPKKIGIITALSGAAIRDIESRLKNKLLPNIIVYNSIMQGKDAESSIIKGIQYFQKNPVDFIVITRGGGSLEDLMCFNSEQLVIAIYNSTIPIITAVGHEVDWTLVDYVADLRLPTPTSVAEYIGISKSILKENISYLIKEIRKNIRNRLNKKKIYLLKIIHKIDFIIKERKIQLIQINYIKINNIFNKITNTIINNYKNKYYKIRLLSIKLSRFNVASILKQGFALIKKDNFIINEKYDFVKNDELTICFLNKKIKVKVI